MNHARIPTLAALALALCVATPLHAVDYTVNNAGSGGDSNTSDSTCSTATPPNGTTCTLRAAIMQASAKAGPHTIKFAATVTKITLSQSLPAITAPVVLDGTSPNPASGGRVEIDGGGVADCIVLSDVQTSVNAKGATGSTVKNLVLRRCSGDGIDASGHGYTITGNRIGTNPGASSSSGIGDANAAAGISISGTITPPTIPPNLDALLATLPQGIAGVQALQASLQAALTLIANPTLIAGNVVSGNMGPGIDIFGQGTANVIVAGNIVGLSQDGLSAIPNGRGPGGSSNRAGIRLSGTAWGNFIGPGNLVSGNMGHGISLDSGSVLLPNFVAGNLVGLGSAPGVDVGNGDNGIHVDTFPKPAPNPNPAGIAAIVGPANTISDNKSESPSEDLDVVNADTSGGMIITGSSTKIRVFANVFGLATIPAGSTPLGQLQFGNAGNGLVVTTPDNDIRNNLILANARHGILVRGGSAVRNVIRGNYVGVSVPTGLAPFVGLGNTGDGIHVWSASSNTIGGPAPSDANVVAGNGRNGVVIRQGSSTSGWANLVTRNRIYGNARGGSGIGIDLEHPINAPDPVDTLDNPSTNYANFDQHRPTLCGGAGAPAACGSAKAPEFGGSGGGTALSWTVQNRPDSTIRVEFFANAADGSDQVYLGEKIVTTDAQGLPNGAGCTGGVCVASVGGSTDTSGMSIVATSTDLFPIDVPPTGDQPDVLPLTPANNTSEFSDALVATRKLEITTEPPLPSGMTGAQYAGVTFAATGGSGSYVNWTISNGAAPAGLLLGAATGTLAGTPTQAGTFTFTVKLVDSVGNEAFAAYSVTVAATPPLVITTASPLPAGQVDTEYTVTFAASGGTGTADNWQLQAGELPDGLSLAAATGVLDGTPTEVGTFEFNVQVTDDQPKTTVKAYTLTIAPAPVPLAITTASPLPDATEGVLYERTLEATGGSGVYVSWAVTSGMLPAGVALDAASGELSGKPSVAGPFNATIRVTDDAGATASKAFALTVDPAPPPPPAGPIFTASPSDIDFGEVRVGQTSIVNVRLTNLDPMNSVTPRFTQPSAASGFAVDAGTCTAALAPDGGFCTMMVAFTPTAGDGTEFASSSSICRQVFQNRCTILIINGPPNLLARLTFEGVGTGTLADVSPTSIDFGSQLIGSTSSVVVDIKNPTDGVLTFNPIPMLSNPNQFQVVNTSCGLGQLAAGGACTLTFRFLPTVPGATESSARIVIGNGSTSEPYDIALRGTGTVTAQPTYTTPMALDFGEVDVGQLESIPVVTTNRSGLDLTLAAALFADGDDDTWSRTFGACFNPISNNESCTINYRFRPRAQGAYAIDTQLTATGTGVNRVIPLALRGTGVGSLVSVAPVALDFGTVNVGTIGRGAVSIENTSVDALDVTIPGAFPFLFSENCPATLAAGASCTINYRLQPTGEPLGPVATQLTLLFANATTGNSQLVTIDLSGNVVDRLFSNGFE